MYDNAKEALQLLTKRKEVKLILFTSSYPPAILPVVEMMEDNEIFFDYLNENPEVENTATGYFNDKFYYNIFLDDKAGFDPYEDWQAILDFYGER